MDTCLNPEHFHDVTGYTNPLESEHDIKYTYSVIRYSNVCTYSKFNLFST